MTGELGYRKQAVYEFWHVFAEQALRQFGPTHEVEKSLRETGSVICGGDITKFLLELENLNIHARVTGIALRKMIEDAIPKHALRRLSLRESGEDGEWLEAVRTVNRAAEDFKERTSLRGGVSLVRQRAKKESLRIQSHLRPQSV